MKKYALLPKIIITATISMIVILGSIFAGDKAEAMMETASVSDKAEVLSADGASSLESKLAVIEKDTGLQFSVLILGQADPNVNEAAEAKSLAGLSESTVSIVLNAETKSLQMDRGKKVSEFVPQTTFTNIIDGDIIPKLSKGEYAEAILDGAKSIGIIYSNNNPEIQAGNNLKSILTQYGVPVLIGTIFLLIAITIIMVKSNRSAVNKSLEEVKKLENDVDNLKDKVLKFWSEMKPSIVEEYEKAGDSDERVAVMESHTQDFFQTFAPTSASLSQMVMTFVYPLTRDSKLSIESLKSQAQRVEKNKTDIINMWDSLTEAERQDYRDASSETHQELLSTQFFPNSEPEIVVSRLKTFVPDSNPLYHNFETKAEEQSIIRKYSGRSNIT